MMFKLLRSSSTWLISSPSLHSLSRWAMESLKFILTMGRGGTVLASFRWILMLNASNTGFPSFHESLILGSKAVHFCQYVSDLSSEVPWAFDNARSRDIRNSNLASIAAVASPSFAPSHCVAIRNGSMTLSSEVLLRRFRLKRCVTKSSS